jgi:putative cell wall-binding protein/heat shock protein HslJ
MRQRLVVSRIGRVVVLVTLMGTLAAACGGDSIKVATSTDGDATATQKGNPFSDSAWELEALISSDGARRPRAADSDLSFTDSRVDVRAACNEMHGSYKAGGQTLEIGVGWLTDRPCPGAAGDQETHVLSVLQGTPTWDIQGDTLVLTRPEDGRGMRYLSTGAQGDDADDTDGDDTEADDARDPDDPVRRIAGPNRFATAAALAPHVDGDTLWVATGSTFTDALAASATGSGPVLLVTSDFAPQATVDAARALKGIERVQAVGGPAVVGDGPLQEVADAAGVASPERLAGAGRFETAAAVSEHAHQDGAGVAYVSTGLGFGDALTASVAAADDGGPVLLSTQSQLPAATRSELDRLAPAEIVIVGGESAVGPEVEGELTTYADSVARVAGVDRFATAAAVSTHRGTAPEKGFVATGETFPDVLAAAPAAITADAALLLTGKDALPDATRSELDRLGVDRVTIAGGPSAVSAAVANELRAVLSGEAMQR